MNVEPYQFADAERIRLGRYPALDTVLYRWARKIEETLFEQFHLELYAGASIVEELKFSAFYASLKRPRPIYFFGMAPFEGEALFVLDNRFSNLCLRTPGDVGPVSDAMRLAPHNHGKLQRVVQHLLADFDQCWADIHPVQTQLNRITTYLFRARILNPYEPCLVAQIHLSGEHISSRMIWCFPKVMLEPILERISAAKVVPSLVVDPARAKRMQPQQLLERARFAVRVNVGTVDASAAGENFRVGGILPLHSAVGGRAVMEINGRPLLVGSIGEVQGRYAMHIEGGYAEQRAQLRKAPGEFRAISWPSG